jgi:hypothetical protein
LQHFLSRKVNNFAKSLVILLSFTASATMSVAVSAPPNPQPSQPQERAYQHLPPRSYAEATVDAGESLSEAKGAATAVEPHTSQELPPQERQNHHLTPKSYAAAAVEGTDKDAGESSSEPNGAATVVEPLNSKSSQPQERANHDLLPKSYAQATVEGTDKDAGESSSEAKVAAAVAEPFNSRSSQPQEQANHHLQPKSYAAATAEGTDKDVGELRSEANGAAVLDGVNGSVKVNGSRRNIDEDRVLYDKHTSPKGERLTSIKPDESYEEGLKHDADSAPRRKGRSGKKQDPNDEKLASGRRAGAGWERSALVFCSRNSSMLTFAESAGHLLMFRCSVDFRHLWCYGIQCVYQSLRHSFLPFVLFP